MKHDPPILLLIKLMPIAVLVVALLDSSAVLPIFAFFLILFPLVTLKFTQQVLKDFSRELYLNEKDKQNNDDWGEWYRVPFNFFESTYSSKLKSNDYLQSLHPHLQVLGLSWPCTEEELTQAYRRRARKTHPDMPGGSHKEFIRVKEAYETLRDRLRSRSMSGKS